MSKNTPVTTEPTALTEAELRQLQEVHIPVNLKGLRDAWVWLFDKAPFGLYQGAMRRVEGFSKGMMTGNASLFGFPLGIILRNTSRAAYNSSDDGYFHSSQAVGVLVAIGAIGAATVAAGPAIAGVIGAGVVGTVIGWGVGLGASALVLHRPAYTIGTLASATVVATAVAAFSTLIAAPANLIVGWRRSRASLKGIKLTEDQLAARAAEFDRYSPTLKYHRELEYKAQSALQSLPAAKREKIYESLKAEFEKAATEVVAPAAEAAAPEAPKLSN